MIHNGRVIRQEIKCCNIKPGKEEAAWSMLEAGLLASRYATLFADSIATSSFYTEEMDVDSHDASKVINLDALRQEYVQNYKSDNINMATHPLMRRYCDDTCMTNIHEEIARVASVSCLHGCIQVHNLITRRFFKSENMGLEAPQTRVFGFYFSVHYRSN